MSRSGYNDDYDADFNLYRGNVANAITGRRGQAFLRELAASMDAMPVKELIAHELVNEQGACCTIGVVCKARGLNVEQVDPYSPRSVGDLVGVAWQMAAEIEFLNDECGRHDETPAQRWQRMRKWVSEHLETEVAP